MPSAQPQAFRTEVYPPVRVGETAEGGRRLTCTVRCLRLAGGGAVIDDYGSMADYGGSGIGMGMGMFPYMYV